MAKTLLDVVCVYLERQDVDVTLDALQYAIEGVRDEINKCNDPDFIEKLQKRVDDAIRVMNRITESTN